MAEIWEQLPHESSNAFAAFLFYRESIPPRSVLKSYRAWSKNPNIKKASGRWAQWARDHRWGERASAYDRRIDGVRQQAKEKVVAEIHEQHAREIELSKLSILKETSALALSRITDVVEWDETGRVTRVIPSKDLPDHAAAAISKLTVVHDKNGNPNMQIEMHPKVRPIDLAGQNLSLWEDAKEQAQKTQTNAFLDFLTFIKSGGMRNVPSPFPKSQISLRNPPPGITITRDGIDEGNKK